MKTLMAVLIFSMIAFGQNTSKDSAAGYVIGGGVGTSILSVPRMSVVIDSSRYETVTKIHPQEHSFEKLTSEEAEDLKEAKEHLESVERIIKVAHGEYVRGETSSITTAECRSAQIQVDVYDDGVFKTISHANGGCF